MWSCETARPPRGAALVITLLVMAVLLLAGTTFMTIASTESQIALSERASSEALGIAEAGLRRAILKLSDPATYPNYAAESGTAVGRGSFAVAVSNAATQACPSNDGKSILVTAQVPVMRGATAQAQVAASVDRQTAPYRYAAFAAVPNQVVFDASATSPLRQVFGVDRQESELWLGASVQTDSFNSNFGAYNASTNRSTEGAIGGNADVNLDAGVQVNGSVRAGDAINAGSGVAVSGGRTSGLAPSSTSPGEAFAPISMPSPATWALDLALPQWAPYTNFMLSAGTYYVSTINMPDNRTLEASGGIVTIYVSGNVTLGNNVRLGSQTSPSNMRIITKSDAAMTTNPETAGFTAGNNVIFAGTLYGRNTNVGIGTDSAIYGSLIGRTIAVGARSQLHYDVAVSKIRHCSSGRYTIRPGTWREVLPY
jgi:Tfp pilus assembly protein PilX